METSSLPRYQVFGSANSLDLDVCFFVDILSTIAENKLILSGYESILQTKVTKKVNGNLAIVKNGILVECYKGTIDELNNALYYTWCLHEQLISNQVFSPVERNLNLKILRCSRTIISYFTRTYLRADAKHALQSSLNQRIVFLSKLKLSDFSAFGKHGTRIEIYKSIAFQLGQTIALLNSKELYTKEGIIIECPSLKKYLNREYDTCDALQTHLDFFTVEAVKCIN